MLNQRVYCQFKNIDTTVVSNKKSRRFAPAFPLRQAAMREGLVRGVVRLRQLAGDGVEHGLQVLADDLHGADDHNGDQGGDQAVLDGGHAGVVAIEGDEFLHSDVFRKKS
jgi:hypothetical protein